MKMQAMLKTHADPVLHQEALAACVDACFECAQRHTGRIEHLGVRRQTEIEAERYALRVMRGDLQSMPTAGDAAAPSAYARSLYRWADGGGDGTQA